MKSVIEDGSVPQITCFMKSLGGNKQIYKIAGDSLFYFNRKVKLDDEGIARLK